MPTVLLMVAVALGVLAIEHGTKWVAEKGKAWISRQQSSLHDDLVKAKAELVKLEGEVEFWKKKASAESTPTQAPPAEPPKPA